MKVFPREGPSGPRLLLHGPGRGSGYSPIRPLIDWLDYNGYTMVTKPTKEFTDAMGRRKIKGNMDIELAIDVLEMAEHLDHVILFSGDGDFRRLVEAVQRRGLRVSVGQHHQVLAADGGRRAAPPGRRLHRIVRAGAADRPQPVRACAAPRPRRRRAKADAEPDDAPSRSLMRSA